MPLGSMPLSVQKVWFSAATTASCMARASRRAGSTPVLVLVVGAELLLTVAVVDEGGLRLEVLVGLRDADRLVEDHDDAAEDQGTDDSRRSPGSWRPRPPAARPYASLLGPSCLGLAVGPPLLSTHRQRVRGGVAQPRFVVPRIYRYDRSHGTSWRHHRARSPRTAARGTHARLRAAQAAQPHARMGSRAVLRLPLPRAEEDAPRQPHQRGRRPPTTGHPPPADHLRGHAGRATSTSSG